jgi:hypothetical protein
MREDEMDLVRSPRPKRTDRTCLKCRRIFLSKGIGNRLCPKCERSNQDGLARCEIQGGMMTADLELNRQHAQETEWTRASNAREE